MYWKDAKSSRRGAAKAKGGGDVPNDAVGSPDGAVDLRRIDTQGGDITVTAQGVEKNNVSVIARVCVRGV